MKKVDKKNDTCIWKKDTFSLEGGGLFDEDINIPGFHTDCDMWVGEGYVAQMENPNVCDTCNRKIEMQ